MITNFYDQLSPYYQYIFQDWNASIDSQAETLDQVIREYFNAGVNSVLDAACGIGTQTIGLAQKGYQVTGSDISGAEVEKARLETSRRHLDVSFQIADMRSLEKSFRTRFDLVIACDNAIPHLLSDDEIQQAFTQFYRVTTELGGCILSVRDYDSVERGGRRLYPRQVHDTPQGKLILFDCWDFDGDFYDMTMYIVEDTGRSVAKTNVIRGGRYYCVSISKLETLMKEAGFKTVFTLKERYFQPLMIGLKK